MKTCPNCGKQIDDAVTTCRYCQSSLSGTPIETRPSERSGRRKWINVVAVLGGVLLLAALLLPAIQGPTESPRRTQCRNDLREIGLALRAYHDKYGTFPPAYVADENGRLLYSWRVLILPYIEQQSLYRRFDLTQPWDSPANRLVLNQMPKIFRCLSDSEAPDNTTSYVAVFGPNCVFSGSRPTAIRDITDGTSNTIMIGEVTGTAIPWTKPEDIDITAQPTIGIPGGLSSRHKGGCQFLFGDGRVKFLSENIVPQTLHDLFIRNDGHKVGAY